MKRRVTTMAVLAAMGGGLVLCQVADATPLPTSSGAFGIAPARRYIVSKPDIALNPTIVSNTTGSGYRVSVFAVLLRQNLTGAFDFSSVPRDLYAARLVLGASPVSFALAPDQQQQVALRWNALPLGKKWVAAGVVFQGVPERQGTTLRVITRLLSVNFLRVPGPVTVDGIFTGLFPEQFAPLVLRFMARVKNVGSDFTAPSDGQLEIRDSAGQMVLTQPWKGIQILPGATVDIPIDVRKLLPAGQYTARVTMRFGGMRTRSVPFRLIGPNEVPAPGIAVEDFNAGATVGSPARVAAKIISTGTAPADVTLRLYLGKQSATPGQNALATGTVVYRELAPGSLTRLSRPLGAALKTGSYRAIVIWDDPTGAPHSLEAEFTTTASSSWIQGFWDSIKRHLVLLIGLLIIGLLLVLAYLYRRQRERQLRLEAELAVARDQLRAMAADPPRARANRSNGATANGGSRPPAKRAAPKASSAKPNGSARTTAPKKPAGEGDGVSPKTRRARTTRDSERSTDTPSDG